MLELQDEVRYKQFFEDGKEVLSWLEDDRSKDLFFACLCKPFGQNSHEFLDLSTDNVKKYSDCVKNLDHKEEVVIFYGAGQFAKILYESFLAQNKKIIFCDRRWQELKEFDGFPVISPKEMEEKYKNAPVVVTTGEFYFDVAPKLKELGFSILNEYPSIDLDQYFDPLVKFGEDEIFVDVGVLNGKTSLIFAEKCPNYKEIHMIEPNEAVYQDLQTVMGNLHDVNLHPVGLWNEKTKLFFSAELLSGACVSETGTVEVKVDTLDHLLQGKPATFIKMDIEGAELKALMGAKETILKHYPKLAISIYHKDEDFIEIPRYLKTLQPNYRFYIRQYAPLPLETVLYAIPS